MKFTDDAGVKNHCWAKNKTSCLKFILKDFCISYMLNLFNNNNFKQIFYANKYLVSRRCRLVGNKLWHLGLLTKLMELKINGETCVGRKLFEYIDQILRMMDVMVMLKWWRLLKRGTLRKLHKTEENTS